MLHRAGAATPRARSRAQLERSPASRSQSEPDVRGGCVAERSHRDALEIAFQRSANGPSHSRDARRRHAQHANTEADEQPGRLGVACHLAAYRELDARSLGGFDREPYELEKRRMKRVAIPLQRRVASIRGERVLE